MKIAGLILALLTALPITARTAADFFAKAPLEAVPVLTPNARLDMLDYFHSGVETATANTLGGKSRIIAEEPMKLRAEISKSSELQVAVLPNKGDTIVAFIETVASPVKDSYVTFTALQTGNGSPTRNSPTSTASSPPKPRGNRHYRDAGYILHHYRLRSHPRAIFNLQHQFRQPAEGRTPRGCQADRFLAGIPLQRQQTGEGKGFQRNNRDTR